jgi:hypothetical protein
MKKICIIIFIDLEVGTIIFRDDPERWTIGATG